MADLTLKNKKITKIGDSFGFIIDMPYFKNGQISKKKRYNLTISESSHNDNDNDNDN